MIQLLLLWTVKADSRFPLKPRLPSSASPMARTPRRHHRNSSVSRSATINMASTSWRSARSRAGRRSRICRGSRIMCAVSSTCVASSCRSSICAVASGKERPRRRRFTSRSSCRSAPNWSVYWPTACSTSVSLDGTQIQPVPRVVQAARLDFLSGIVTVDDAMIALIDLSNLLSVNNASEAA